MNILLLIVLILLGLLIFKTVFCDSFLGDSFLGDRSRGDGSVSARNSWVARKYDLPKEWSWARISMNEASIFEKLTNTKIQPGNYTSPVINQHRSGWCGCCYLIAVIQMIEDRWTIGLKSDMLGSPSKGGGCALHGPPRCRMVMKSRKRMPAGIFCSNH